MDETTIDLPDAIREGCALRLTRDVTDAQGRTWPKGAQVTCCGRLFDSVVTEVDAALTAADVVIDLDPGRASGQWAVAMWWRSVPKWPASIVPADRVRVVSVMGAALAGEADPAELRRVALEVRGG